MKVILMGRILEILHSHNPSRYMSAKDIADELKKMEFSRAVRSYIERGGGINPGMVAHLLLEMRGKSGQPPFGIAGTALVSYKQRKAGVWKVRGKYG
ncbi:MAG: hypothetical protein HWN68_09615 [Desulfobacterales bacterium]|nr:hypothetical protein [Desulfobacterales bacterium]